MTQIARDIFAKTTPKPTMRSLYAAAGFKRREGPRQLNIRSRECRKCGETVTSVTRYFCAGCHFKGWWGRWA